MESNLTAPRPEIKVCPHCSASMPATASFCRACEQFEQIEKPRGDRLAIISVLNALVVTVVLLFEKLPSVAVFVPPEVVFTKPTCYLDRAFLVGGNAGNGFAVVEGGTVEYLDKKSNKIDEMELAVAPGTTQLIGARSAVSMELRFMSRGVPQPFIPPEENEVCTYKLKLRGKSFPGGHPLPGDLESCACALYKYEEANSETADEKDQSSPAETEQN